jgi:hypothetical protein
MAIAKNDNPEVSRTSSCYILSLPPEVLIKILSFILPSGFLQHCYGDMSLGFLKTLGAIRSICRTIRSVADNLPFWYDEDFEWLYPGSYYRNRKAGLQYLEVMLADSHLRDCLSRRKRDWCVASYNPATLEILMRTMPGFKENAESLKEVVYETGTDGLDHLNCWKDTRVSESSPLLPERPMSTRKTFQPHFGNYRFGIGPPARIVCAQESGVAIVIGTA